MKIVKFKKYPEYVIEKYCRETELYRDPWKPKKDLYMYKLEWSDGDMSVNSENPKPWEKGGHYGYYNKTRALDLIKKVTVQKLEGDETTYTK